jgi:hypothetical protein
MSTSVTPVGGGEPAGSSATIENRDGSGGDADKKEEAAPVLVVEKKSCYEIAACLLSCDLSSLHQGSSGLGSSDCGTRVAFVTAPRDQFASMGSARAGAPAVCITSGRNACMLSASCRIDRKETDVLWPLYNLVNTSWASTDYKYTALVSHFIIAFLFDVFVHAMLSYDYE